MFGLTWHCLVWSIRACVRDAAASRSRPATYARGRVVCGHPGQGRPDPPARSPGRHADRAGGGAGARSAQGLPHLLQAAKQRSDLHQAAQTHRPVAAGARAASSGQAARRAGSDDAAGGGAGRPRGVLAGGVCRLRRGPDRGAGWRGAASAGDRARPAAATGDHGVRGGREGLPGVRDHQCGSGASACQWSGAVRAGGARAGGQPDLRELPPGGPCRQAAGVLEDFVAHVRALLRDAPALHVDETPARTAGGLAYVHVACTRYLTLLHVGDRSAEAIDAGGVLPGYDGIIVRDGYGGYAHLTEALHAWCGAHLLRDLRDVYEFEPGAQRWAHAMAELLVEARDAAEAARAAGQTALAPAVLADLVGRYRALAAQGLEVNQHRPGRTAADAVRLARRFQTFEDMILRFVTHPGVVAFTNNTAEAAIRGVKVQMRSSRWLLADPARTGRVRRGALLPVYRR